MLRLRSLIPLVGLVVLAIILLLVLLFKDHFFPQQITTIVYNGHSFQPDTVTIPFGGTVIFENKGKFPFWPASNLHPSHLEYPEFDPQKPIGPGDSWQFTFTRAGNWGFHNHLLASSEGVVTVLKKDGSQPDPLDCTKDENKQKCWENKITLAINEGGVDEAFDIFSNLYSTEPGFASACHGISHIMGAQAYKQFVNKDSFTLSPKVSYCGFGFFHGFMEALLVTSGNIQEARDFCTYVGDTFSSTIPFAQNACYHGIGHGAVDGGDPRYFGDAQALMKPGFDLCEAVGQTDWETYLCGTGVINGIAIAINNGDFGLSMTPDNVMKLCEDIDTDVFKRACYDQINTIIYKQSGYDISKSFEILSTMKEKKYFDSSMRSLAGVFAHNGMTDEQYQNVIKQCYTWDGSTRDECIIGFVAGLIEFGPPTKEYTLGFDFCDTQGFDDQGRYQCYEGIMEISGTYYDAPKVASICARIPEDMHPKTMAFCTPSTTPDEMQTEYPLPQQ